MNPMKLKLLEEILSHLSDSQAGDLKSLLDNENKPEAIDSLDAEEITEVPGSEEIVDKSDVIPGLEKEASIPGEEDMSDEELSELIKKHLS